MTIPARYRERLWLSSGEITALAPITRRRLAELCSGGVLKARKEGAEWWVAAESAWEWLGAKAPEPEKLHPIAARILGR
jgi:hypothetical protein